MYTVFHALGLPASTGTLFVWAISALLLMALGAVLLKKKSLRKETYIRANIWLSAYVFAYVYICALTLAALWPDVQLALSGADERVLAFSSAMCTLCLAALLALGILQSIMLLTLTRFAASFAWRWHFIHFFFFIAALALLPFKFMDIFETDYFSAFSMCIRYSTLWDVLIAAAGAAVCLVMISSLKRDGPFVLLGISKQETKG